MKKYPAEHWEALGRWVYEARMQTPYRDMKAWSAEVGRSSRVLLGLERGEPQGAKTIEAVAESLGVAAWSLFNILTTGESESWWTDESVAEAKAEYSRETGLLVPDEPRGLLSSFTSEQLLGELAHRLKAADTPQAPWVRIDKSLRKSDPVSGPSDTTELAAATEEVLEPEGLEFGD